MGEPHADQCPMACPHGDRCVLRIGHDGGCNYRRCDCNEPAEDIRATCPGCDGAGGGGEGPDVWECRRCEGSGKDRDPGQPPLLPPGEPRAVLLVPVDGDPGGLLAEGLCGSRPPGVYLTNDWDRPRRVYRAASYSVANALPLWWDGALVPEGWDRFRRWALDRSEVDGSEGHDACTDMYVDVRAVLAGARWAADTLGLCRVVVLDADGREVTP